MRRFGLFRTMARKKGLTEKQKRFIEEYIVDCNATQAAIRAGYSAKSAGYNADSLMKDPLVKELLAKRMAEKQDELIAKQDEVLRYLTSVMRRQEKEYVVVTVSEETEDYVADDSGALRKVRNKKDTPVTVEIPSKLSDSNKAAELLGKRYSLFTDRVDLDADLDINVKVDYGDGESSDKS